MPVNTGKYRLGPRGQAEIKNRAIERLPDYDVSHVVSGLTLYSSTPQLLQNFTFARSWLHQAHTKSKLLRLF